MMRTRTLALVPASSFVLLVVAIAVGGAQAGYNMNFGNKGLGGGTGGSTPGTAPTVKFTNRGLDPDSHQRAWEFTGAVIVSDIAAGPNASTTNLEIYAEVRFQNGSFAQLADVYTIDGGPMLNGTKLTDAQVSGTNNDARRVWMHGTKLTAADSENPIPFSFSLTPSPGPVEYRFYAQITWSPDNSVDRGKRESRYAYEIMGPYPWLKPLASNPPTGSGAWWAPLPPIILPIILPPRWWEDWWGKGPWDWLDPTKHYRVFIDGQILKKKGPHGHLIDTDAPPTDLNGRVLVGLTDIFQALGATVAWEGSERKITATRGARHVQLWIGRKTALVDGQSITLDVPPMILAGGKTYVPVRFVSQALLAGVSYNTPTRSVMITTSTMPPLTGSAQTPYVTPSPGQGLVQVATCLETGLRSAGICPNTLRKPYTAAAVPGPCTTHTQGPKLIVLSPSDGGTVPERFEVSGTCVPGRKVRVTVIAEATLKATGENATSPILEDAEAKVGTDGKWSIEANARGVSRDKRVDVKQFKITVYMRKNRQVAEQVDLTVRP